MPALFSARVKDLFPDRLLTVQCGDCEYFSELPASVVKEDVLVDP